jgi:hypothetical protein
MVDPELAKKQLDVLTREWYLHPNGQIPAYEWNFSDVNPPVHAWAVWRTYNIERKMHGRQDTEFLERVFQKLLLNFTWWVNRKDADGNNVFEGGFLGLDNIGVFNRSEPLPTGGRLEQADATAWMAFYCLQMLQIALELARYRRTYEGTSISPLRIFVNSKTLLRNSLNISCSLPTLYLSIPRPVTEFLSGTKKTDSITMQSTGVDHGRKPFLSNLSSVLFPCSRYWSSNPRHSRNFLVSNDVLNGS